MPVSLLALKMWTRFVRNCFGCTCVFRSRNSSLAFAPLCDPSRKFCSRKSEKFFIGFYLVTQSWGQLNHQNLDTTYFVFIVSLHLIWSPKLFLALFFLLTFLFICLFFDHTVFRTYSYLCAQDSLQARLSGFYMLLKIELGQACSRQTPYLLWNCSTPLTFFEWTVLYLDIILMVWF